MGQKWKNIDDQNMQGNYDFGRILTKRRGNEVEILLEYAKNFDTSIQIQENIQ